MSFCKSPDFKIILWARLSGQQKICGIYILVQSVGESTDWWVRFESTEFLVIENFGG